MSDYYKGLRSEVVQFLPQQYSRVLEIGCGEGGFRANLKADCEYWGVEPFHDAAKVAEKRLDRVLHGTYEDNLAHLPSHYFDLVICNDVIEHMPDHDSFFRSIVDKMTESGSLVGSIPNVRYAPNLMALLFEKDWKYVDWGVLDRTHLRFFTKKSLRRTFRENGFAIELLKGIGAIKFSPFPVKRIFYNLVIPVLGGDTRYMQYGFRIRPHTK